MLRERDAQVDYKKRKQEAAKGRDHVSLQMAREVWSDCCLSVCLSVTSLSSSFLFLSVSVSVLSTFSWPQDYERGLLDDQEQATKRLAARKTVATIHAEQMQERLDMAERMKHEDQVEGQAIQQDVSEFHRKQQGLEEKKHQVKTTYSSKISILLFLCLVL